MITTTLTSPDPRDRLSKWRYRQGQYGGSAPNLFAGSSLPATRQRTSPGDAGRPARSSLVGRATFFAAQLAGLAVLAAWLYLTVIVVFALLEPAQEPQTRTFYNALANEHYTRTQSSWGDEDG